MMCLMYDVQQRKEPSIYAFVNCLCVLKKIYAAMEIGILRLEYVTYVRCNSEIGADVWSLLCFMICLRHLRAVKNRRIFLQKDLDCIVLSSTEIGIGKPQ